MNLKTYLASGWSLFIDSSEISIQADLLYNSNTLASVSIATCMKEECVVTLVFL